jgi:hypothetical protein
MSDQTPEYYADVFSVGTSSLGVAITFGAAPPKDEVEGHDICTVRLSHGTAKTMAMGLRRLLRQYERDVKTNIVVPTEMIEELGLALEDW